MTTTSSATTDYTGNLYLGRHSPERMAGPEECGQAGPLLHAFTPHLQGKSPQGEAEAGKRQEGRSLSMFISKRLQK